jgi:hypothetical protein
MYTPQEIRAMKDAVAKQATVQGKLLSRLKVLISVVVLLFFVSYLCAWLGPQKITTEQLAFGFLVVFLVLQGGLFYFLLRS